MITLSEMLNKLDNYKSGTFVKAGWRRDVASAKARKQNISVEKVSSGLIRTEINYENLERRLRSRGTNTESDILRRLETAKRELTLLDEYDYIVINRDGEADTAVEQIRTIITAEELSVKRNRDFPESFYKTH